MMLSFTHDSNENIKKHILPCHSLPRTLNKHLYHHKDHLREAQKALIYFMYWVKASSCHWVLLPIDGIRNSWHNKYLLYH